MKQKFLIALQAAGILFLAGCYIYFFFFAEEIDIKYMSKLLSVTATYCFVYGRRYWQFLQESRKYYSKAYKKDIRNAFCEDEKNLHRLLAAVALYDKGKHLKAAAKFQKLLSYCEKNTDYSVVFLFQGLCYHEEEMYTEAAECYEKSVAYDYCNAKSWYHLGVIYDEQFQNEVKCMEAYKNAVTLEPENPLCHNKMGICCFSSQKYEQAAECFLKALKYRLSKKLASYNLTLTYRMLGDSQNAEKYQKLYEENGGDIHELEETYSCYVNE